MIDQSMNESIGRCVVILDEMGGLWGTSSV